MLLFLFGEGENPPNLFSDVDSYLEADSQPDYSLDSKLDRVLRCLCWCCTVWVGPDLDQTDTKLKNLCP